MKVVGRIHPQKNSAGLFINSSVTSSDRDCFSGHGSCECGDCQCDQGAFGDFCECVHTGCASNSRGLCGGKI